jgi:hypothetical protein
MLGLYIDPEYISLRSEDSVLPAASAPLPALSVDPVLIEYSVALCICPDLLLILGAIPGLDLPPGRSGGIHASSFFGGHNGAGDTVLEMSLYTVGR